MPLRRLLLRAPAAALIEIDYPPGLLELRATDRLERLAPLARAAVQEDDGDAARRAGDAIPQLPFTMSM